MTDCFQRCLVIIILFLFGFCYSESCYGGSLCTEKNATLDCLKNNFDELYMTDYNLFFEILEKAKIKATSCKSYIYTANFLELAKYGLTNAEFAEYFGEVIEELLINNPKCFFDSALIVDGASLKNLIYKLQSPITDNDKKIRKTFEKYRMNKKYKKVINLYFNKKQAEK